MSIPTESQVRSIAGKASSLYPQWTSLPEKDGSGSSSFDAGALPALGEGVSVDTAINAFVRLHLREDIRCRKMEVSITTVADSSPYRVSLFGTDYTYTSDSDATAVEIIDGLAALITAGSHPVTVTKTSTLLTIKGDYSDSNNRSGDILSPDVSIPSGGGGISMSVEASEVTWQLLTRSKSLPAGKDAWCMYQFPNGDIEHVVEEFSYEERIQVAGLKEIAIRIISTDGTVTPMVGVCAESD